MYSITVLNLSLFRLCAAAWSWTLNCRKISSSLWWRDCIPRTSLCSPLCRILRRPSAPRPNASPKRRPRNTRAGNSGFCDRRITHNWSSYFQYRSLSTEHRYRSICSLDLFFDQDDSGKSYQIVFLFVFLALLVLYGREYWTRFGNTATSINKKIIIYIYVYLTEFWNFLLEKWNNETISLMQSVKLF